MNTYRIIVTNNADARNAHVRPEMYFNVEEAQFAAETYLSDKPHCAAVIVKDVARGERRAIIWREA